LGGSRFEFSQIREFMRLHFNQQLSTAAGTDYPTLLGRLRTGGSCSRTTQAINVYENPSQCKNMSMIAHCYPRNSGKLKIGRL
jgi:hypothetical protein